MVRALERAGAQVACLGPAQPRRLTLAWQAARAAPARVLERKRFYHRQSIPFARDLARSFARKLEGGRYDLALAVAAAPCVAFLETPTPLVYVSDATFDLMIDYYPGFTGLSRASLREGELI